MKNKNTRRLLLVAVIAIFLHMIISSSVTLSRDTAVGDHLKMTLPATVSISHDQNLSFEYPDIFKVYTEDFSVSEIISHVDLLTGNPAIRGYVQVRHITESFSLFLEKSKAEFNHPIINFKESFPSGCINSREWEYDVDCETAGVIRARQYFSNQDGKMLIVSLLAPKDVWSARYDRMFVEIKNSTRVY